MPLIGPWRTARLLGASSALIALTTKLATDSIARSAALSLTIRIFGIVLVFTQSVLMARTLSVESYGITILSISILNAASVLAVFGFGTYAVREIPRLRAGGQHDSVNHFIHFSSMMVVTVSLILATGLIAAFFLWPNLAGTYGKGISLTAIALPPFALVLLFRGIAQANGNVAKAQLPGEVVRPAIVCAILALAFPSGWAMSMKEVMLLIAVAAGCAAAAGMLAIRTTFDRTTANHHVPGSDRVRWMRGGSSFLGTSILYMVQAETVTILLATISGPAQVGLFQPVLQVSLLVMLPVTAAQVRYAPRVAELWEAGDQQRLTSVTTFLARGTTLVSAVTALAIVGVGPMLFGLFGPQFKAHVDLLWIVAASQVFNAACGPCGMVLSMTGHNRIVLVGLIGTIATMVTVGIPLVAAWGALGGAITMATGVVVFNLALCTATRRVLGIRTTVIGSRGTATTA